LLGRVAVPDVFFRVEPMSLSQGSIVDGGLDVSQRLGLPKRHTRTEVERQRRTGHGSRVSTPGSETVPTRRLRRPASWSLCWTRWVSGQTAPPALHCGLPGCERTGTRP